MNIFVQGNLDNIPPGYEAVSLIEALNGPCTRTIPPVTSQDLSLPELPELDGPTQAAEILNRYHCTLKIFISLKKFFLL